MAINRYVNTNSTPGGDGTTNETTGDHRAYASLNEWEGAEETGLSDVHIVHCTGGSDTTATVVDGWGTELANYIQIQSHENDRHDRVWSTDIYRLEVSNDNALTIMENYVRVMYFQARTPAQDAHYESPIAVWSQYLDNAIYVGYSILRGPNGGSYRNRALNINDADTSLVIYNTLIYDIDSATAHSASIRPVAANSMYIYNCTCDGGDDVIENPSGCVCWVYNTIAVNPGNGNCFTGTFDFGDYNLDDDGSAPGANSVQDGVDGTLDWTNHIKNSGSLGIGDGTDTPFGAPSYDDDIGSYERTSTWDIGADEYITGNIQYLDGQIDAQSSVLGAIKLQREITGQVQGQSVLSADLNATKSIKGEIAGQSGITGSIGLSRKITGAVGGQSTVSGSLKKILSIDGIITGQSVASANIKLSKKISGQITGQSSVAGGLSMTWSLAGTIAATSGLTGNLTTLAISITGQIDAQSSVSGDIKLKRKIAGQIMGQSSVSAELKAYWSLLGDISGQGGTLAYLGLSRKLGGNISGQSDVSGSIKNIMSITGLLSGDSSAIAALNLLRKLTGTIQGQGAASANLAAAWSLAGTISSSSGLTGSLKSLAVAYRIYRGQDGLIDYETIIATMTADQEQVTIENQALEPDTIWHYIRRKVTACCEKESPDSPICVVRIDAGGDMIANAPNPPTDLTIEGLSNGRFRLRWRYTKLDEEITPTGFNIYIDSGSGFNFASPDDTVSYGFGGLGEFEWTSDPLTHGQLYRFCVRCYTTGAGETQNTSFVSGVADAEGPDAIIGLITSTEII